MRALCFALVLLLATAVTTTANALERMEKTGSFGTFLGSVRRASKRRDVKGFARFTHREFTVGEELGRAPSLGALGENPRRLDAMVRLIDRGACYRLAKKIVHCEFPDPGPELDRSPNGRNAQSTIAIFERVRGGWRVLMFSAP